MAAALNYLFGQPESSGDLRSQLSDFKVFEQLPYQPCGEGEHLYIYLRKTNQNTITVARELAKYFSVKENLVTYAGLKDRFAITEQWFGVHVPGKQQFNLTDLAIEGVEVLEFKRHNKKLRVGALSGNRFELTLRNVSKPDDILRRWAAVQQFGVPNYFGEQRFGINGGNLDKALELFSGKKVKDKKKRGMYLSAARSAIFNEMVSQRLQKNTFESLTQGDVFMLAGTQSVFLADEIDHTIEQRFREKDIDLTAPLWGAGELMSQDDTAAFEQATADEFPEFCQGLAKFGLKQERRKIRLSFTQGNIAVKDNKVVLSFVLPAGCYATTILRELINYQDIHETQVSQLKQLSQQGQHKQKTI
jgi:tRNA pseudouridine13 synthase